MSIYHYIIILISGIGFFIALQEKLKEKEKDKTGFIAIVVVYCIWFSMIVLSAYR